MCAIYILIRSTYVYFNKFISYLHASSLVLDTLPVAYWCHSEVFNAVKWYICVGIMHKWHGAK